MSRQKIKMCCHFNAREWLQSTIRPEAEDHRKTPKTNKAIGKDDSINTLKETLEGNYSMGTIWGWVRTNNTSQV